MFDDSAYAIRDRVAMSVSFGVRLAIEPRTGLNKYLCPSRPSPDILCFSSCTASPISETSFACASTLYASIAGAPSPRRRSQLLAEHRCEIGARVLGHYASSHLAEAILCPSGTDALLTTAMLLASERPSEPMTSILPCASETGTGVPLAAACRQFDGPDSGALLSDAAVSVVEIPLRSDAGAPRADSEVIDAYRSAAKAVRGRAVVYLTHGTKTGLIAPLVPPAEVDVVVDACQGRLAPSEVVTYLAQGFPVVVTGSKFYGGPAFSGAVLFPRERLMALRRQQQASSIFVPSVRADPDPDIDLATLLRWMAALDVMDAFRARELAFAALLRDRKNAVASGIASMEELAPVDGMYPRGSGWADQPSIFTFAVRDPANPQRLLSMMELRNLYELLARDGVLLGQPVHLGSFGGLRIAFGARDLVDGSDNGGLPRLFDALRGALGSPSLCGAA